MYSFTNNLSKKEYDKFVENYSMASFMQEYNWANVKDNWKSFHCGLYKDKKLVGVCLILVKNILKNLNIFYIPRGYLIDFTNYEDLKAMTDNVRKLAKENKAYAVKIDPNFCINQYSFKGNKIAENYSINYNNKNINLLKLGYKNTGIHKEIGKNLQPQYNMFAPLCDVDSKILSEEETLKTYKSKFKYYIGSFHEKRGVSFEITNDINRVKDLVNLLKQTEIKQNISLRNEEYFKKIMENYKNQAYLVFGYIDLNKYIEFLKNNNSKEEDLIEAKNLLNQNGNNMILSASLMILPGNKKGIRTSEYLYAGNSLNLTKLRVSTGVVFEILKFSIKNNCHYCNLGGIDGNLNDHLTMFKEKFNGQVLIFSGEYDLPISWIYKPINLLYPILLKIYKKIKR